MHANVQSILSKRGYYAAVGFKDIKTGDTLCDENKSNYLESGNSAPVIDIAIEPRTKVADVDTGYGWLN
jgi:elongation factor G